MAGLLCGIRTYTVVILVEYNCLITDLPAQTIGNPSRVKRFFVRSAYGGFVPFFDHGVMALFEVF